MKISLEWINDYVDISDIKLNELVDRLINVGFNIEQITDFGGDTVVDLEITSNRPDCLGHIGVAREIATIFGKELRLPDCSVEEEKEKIDELTSVEVRDPEGSPIYTARLIRGVTVGQSPSWLVRRLEAVGLRGINNIVDITNYVLMEFSQPLHAFDFNKLEGKRIIVRRAEEEEEFVAIDHNRYRLSSSDLVIADAKKPVALAGIIGGLDTEITADTTDVLLESALFDPVCIRRTSRRLGIQTDSSYRFERKVDPEGVELASRRAASLICKLAGGSLLGGVAQVYSRRWPSKVIEFDTTIVKRILGIEIEREICLDILKRLGFGVKGLDKERFSVVIPSFRQDITRPIDLVEEIGRIFGLDKVPSREKISIVAQPISDAEQKEKIIHSVFNHCGFTEAITLTLTRPEYAGLFSGLDRESVLKVEPVHKMANNSLRSSILPSLLQAYKLNQDHGNKDANFYEIARVFLPPLEKGGFPREKVCLACLYSRPDLRPIRGVFELIERFFNIEGKMEFLPKRIELFDEDKSAAIVLFGEEIGFAGIIREDVQRLFDLKRPVAVAEIDYERLFEVEFKAAEFKALPRFPAIRRDFSILVDETISWKMIEDAVRSIDVPYIEKVEFGEVFRGKQIPEGKKSIFFSVVFRSPDRSLTHDEIDNYQKLIVDSLQRSCKAVLRSN